MYNFKFADIGEGIHEGQILKWLKNEGDQVQEGETIVVIETDKVNAEISSPVTGILNKQGAKVGEVILVGQTLALIDGGSKTIEPKEVKMEASVIGNLEVSSDVIETFEDDLKDLSVKRTLATPLARKLAKDLKIDINEVVGTGENGRVLKEDLLNFKVSSPLEQPQKTKVQGVTRVPISTVRKAIVKAMTISKATIPHTVLMDEVIITDLVKFRNTQKDLAKTKGIKLTYMAFIMRAVLLAIKDAPIFNASFDEKNEEIVYQDDINLGIAVDTNEGLIVPNIKNADKLSIFALAEELQKLAEAAKDRSLQLDQIQNGTFTITNYGAVDALYGTPIIKHPEVAVLGIGKIHKQPVVINNEITIGEVLPLSLAVDHRIIDGADAGRFLIKIKEFLSNPMLLLLN
ncbi:MAG: dihydrolipoamide acetyltransferase family protein [Bacilli bacterium]|nr:dihydrolipoamide acetyltransferase family protein [Bacilli bacterium]